MKLSIERKCVIVPENVHAWEEICLATEEPEKNPEIAKICEEELSEKTVRVIFTNAFSPSMLTEKSVAVAFREVTLSEINELLNYCPNCIFESAIGHESTAKLLSELLKVKVPVCRRSIQLTENTILVIVNVSERLPEGKVLSSEELGELLRHGKIRFYVAYVAKGVVKSVLGTRAIAKSEEVNRALLKVGLLTYLEYEKYYNKCVECCEEY